MIESYPIPAFYLAKREDKMYDGLDGKQRTEAIRSFMDNEWELEDEFIVTDEHNEEHDFSGFTFADLPEWAQDEIKNYSLTIYYFEDLTEEQYQGIFFRLNNGVHLAGIELTRASTPSLPLIQKMATHDMIDTAFNEKSKNSLAHENIMIQARTPDFITTKFPKRITQKETKNMKNINRQQHLTAINEILTSHGFNINHRGKFQRGAVQVETCVTNFKSQRGRYKTINIPMAKLTLNEVETLIQRWHK